MWRSPRIPEQPRDTKTKDRRCWSGVFHVEGYILRGDGDDGLMGPGMETPTRIKDLMLCARFSFLAPLTCKIAAASSVVDTCKK